MIYLGFLILGVVLFSILNFRVLKDIKKSIKTYKMTLEKNLKLKEDTVQIQADHNTEQKPKVKKKP